MNRRRVLIQLPSYDSGGAENYALRLIDRGGNDEYEWHVTSSNRRNAKLEAGFRNSGAQIHHISPGFGNPGQAKSFLSFVRASRFDTVMTLTGVFGGPALALARVAGVARRVGWHRRATPAYAPTLVRRAYAGWALLLLKWGANRILSNGRAALMNHHGSNWLTSDKFAVIPNGVDSERFRPDRRLREAVRDELGIPRECIVIGHVGRFDPAKDHATLLAVVSRLRQELGTLRLLVAGTGTDSTQFRDRLAQAGLHDTTVPLGARSDVERLYQAMDVFLFPSITEGQPNSLIEAMLCGVPIVASDIPGVRDTVPPEQRARVFPPRDVAAASRLVHSSLGDFDTARAQIPWVRERYDLECNLDRVLDELTSERQEVCNS